MACPLINVTFKPSGGVCEPWENDGTDPVSVAAAMGMARGLFGDQPVDAAKLATRASQDLPL